MLQRIAVCYFFAALLFLFFRLRVIVAVSTGLLVGYWLLVTFVPFPDFRVEPAVVRQLAGQAGSDSKSEIVAVVPDRIRGAYEEGRNLLNYLDFRLLPSKVSDAFESKATSKSNVFYVYEGLLSSVPAIAISLFGVFAGLLLRNSALTDRCKVLWLLGAGLAAVVAGFLWSLQFPMIKRIWTSSYCLTAAGYSAMLTAIFYLVVDVWKWRRWCQPFVWIGTNAITLYLAVNIVSFSKLGERFAGGPLKVFLDAWLAPGFGQLVVALMSLSLVIWLARFLHQRRIFLRV